MYSSDGRASAIHITFAEPPQRSRWRMVFKILYALIASVFSIWFVSFTPGPGTGPERVAVRAATTILYVPSGRALLEAIESHRLTAEFMADADAKVAWKTGELEPRLIKAYRKLPSQARALIPFSLEGLFPFAGGDVSVSVADAVGGGEEPPVVIATRVSGYRGQLARMAASVLPAQKEISLYAAGGDLIIVGLNNARPILSENAASAVSPGNEPLLVARYLPPAANAVRRDWRSVLPRTYLDEYDQILPGCVKEALESPPTVFEMLGQPRPVRADLAVWQRADQSFVLEGWVANSKAAATGEPLARATNTAISPIGTAHAEALLPISVKQVFLGLAASALAGKPTATRLHKGQRRWTPRFARWADTEFSLEKDLFPAFGDTLQIAVEDAPAEIDTAGYGLFGLRIPFKGQQLARASFAAAMRAHYGEAVELPNERATHIPYIRIQRDRSRDRYVEATGQIHAPLWDVSEDRIDLVSDAGPLALMKPEGTARPEVHYSEPFASRPAFWYVRLNGVKLAPNVEKIATAEFDGMQEDLGAEAFLQEYADAPNRIKLYGKCARALGELSIELHPQKAGGDLHIKAMWKPGTLKGADVEEDDVVPPPPAQ